jgi:DNA-binding PadR family transcriptional regulator
MALYGNIMKTIYLPYALEFKRKPPKLKFNILERLAIDGKTSKSGLESNLKDRYYPDISRSVDDLKRGGYVDIADRKSGRGKAQVYYTINEKGLKALLSYDDFAPIRFWEILHEYCQNVDRIVTYDKIEEFYQIVVRRHLKDSSPPPFFSQLDIFDDLCNNWFQKTIVKSNGITPLQKVIEILASYPRITFEKLVEETGEPKKRVEEILRSHSHTSKLYEESFSWENINQTYTDFLIQNIITEQFANDAEPTYELSLFGVMLCLVLIRHNDMDRLKGGLYRKLSFERYYDRIALNYKKKLRLIFGKWNQLKGILKVFTYYNFDIILDREIRSKNKDWPSVRKGGNKQLIEGIREIILDNRELMSNFASAGRKVLGNYMIMDLFSRMYSEAVSPSLDGVYWLCCKLNELQVLLDPSPPPTVGMSFLMGFMTQDTRSILKHMEESFADEIAAFYYMNLHSDSDIRLSEPRKYYHSKSFKPLDKTPRQCLSLFVEQDKEKPLIKEWLCKWRDDLTRLQSEVLDNIKAIV